VRQTASAIDRRLRRLVYSKERLIVLVKQLDSIVEPRRVGDLRLEDLSPEDLPQLAELNRARGQPDADRRFGQYVAQGFHGYVAYCDGRPVGYCWWVDRSARRPFPDLRRFGLGIELKEGEVYGSDFFMLEDHRGNGVAADFLFKLESALRDRGYTRLWGYAASDNRPARWIYSIRGYEPMWIVIRKRVLFVRRTTREFP
jgi:GNAT superfamily N-acetyltransferase